MAAIIRDLLKISIIAMDITLQRKSGAFTGKGFDNTILVSDALVLGFASGEYIRGERN